jgi:hypothetical protein
MHERSLLACTAPHDQLANEWNIFATNSNISTWAGQEPGHSTHHMPTSFTIYHFQCPAKIQHSFSSYLFCSAVATARQSCAKSENEATKQECQTLLQPTPALLFAVVTNHILRGEEESYMLYCTTEIHPSKREDDNHSEQHSMKPFEAHQRKKASMQSVQHTLFAKR